jgi:hypothetical protein
MTEKYPGYTSHGHPIPGACGIAGQRPKYIARCGGPAICGTCSLDAERYNAPRPDGNESPTMTDQPNTDDVLMAVAKYRREIETAIHHYLAPAADIAPVIAALAAHDRAVAAKAVRDVADWLFDTLEGPLMCTDKCGDPSCPDDIRINFAGGLQRSLHARADRIGAGDE